MEIQFGYYPQVIPLVLARVAAVIFTVPFFGTENISKELKVVMALVVTMILLPIIPPEWAEIAIKLRTLPELLLAVLGEIILGASVGLICQIFLGMCSIAGTIQGRSSSLMMARTLDPLSRSESGIMTIILQMSFILIVMLNNGHLAILKLVSGSFTNPVVSTQLMDGTFFNMIFSVSVIMFEWGLRMALPLMCAAMIVSVCMGLIGKLAPDFNVLFMSLPIRLAVGICLFGLTLRFSNELFDKLIEQMLLRCASILGLLM